MLNESTPGSTVDTNVDRHEVEQQLERLLNNPHFNQSRRFPSFLRFVIAQTLQGRPELLKERTLGIEIFGRQADYDTASDPIVRVTATEIRKRIAQYYQEPGHERELRVSLPAGSYVPHFHWPQAVKPEVVVEPAALTLPVPEPQRLASDAGSIRSGPRRFSLPWVVVSLTAVFLLLVVGSVYIWRSGHRTSSAYFWGPVVNSTDPVLVCVADQHQYPMLALRDAVDPSHETLLKENLTAIIIDDLNPLVRIASLLQASGKRFSVKGEGVTGLGDLRSGSTIFIGAFDNAWTLRLTSPLRYHFANNPAMTEFRIVDSSNPSQPGWALDRQQQITTGDYRDYALVARFTDNTTGQIAVIVAGIGRGGTRVAGEYLSDPADMEQLQRAAMRAGNKKNMEIVLSTHMIDGEPGSPRVEASYFW